jgi:hypothetical protein
MRALLIGEAQQEIKQHERYSASISEFVIFLNSFASSLVIVLTVNLHPATK